MGRGEKDEHIISDPELVKGCLEGDPRAEEMLYKRYFSFAMSVCIRYTKDENEAMERVNDSFMKVLDNLKEYDTSRPFRTWYSKILINTAIDCYRRNARYNSHLQLEDIAETNETEPEIDAELSAADIITLFNQLPEHYRITFNLYEIEGYSHDEIAGMLGITASTSRANLARAKKMLRELYVKNHISVRQGNEAV